MSTESKKPREFAVCRKDENSPWTECSMEQNPYCENTSMCVSEVIPGEITDTERLDWMINNDGQFYKDKTGWFIHAAAYFQKNTFQTPREAIDAAMKESK